MGVSCYIHNTIALISRKRHWCPLHCREMGSKVGMDAMTKISLRILRESKHDFPNLLNYPGPILQKSSQKSAGGLYWGIWKIWIFCMQTISVFEVQYLEQWVHKTELFHLQFKQILLPHLLQNIVPDKTLKCTSLGVIFPMTLNFDIHSHMPTPILAVILPAVFLYKNEQFCSGCFITDILFQSTWTVPWYRCDIDILPQCTWRSLQTFKPLTFFLQLDSLFKLLIYDNVYLSTWKFLKLIL
jgi:hypothetical protein